MPKDFISLILSFVLIIFTMGSGRHGNSKGLNLSNLFVAGKISQIKSANTKRMEPRIPTKDASSDPIFL